jgi:phosphohistidine swiveling domain-containing protein
MNNIKPAAWKKVVERKHPPLFMDILLRGQERTVFERATGISFALTNVRKVKLGLYVDSNEMKTLMQIMEDSYEHEGSSFFERYAKRCYRICEALLKTAENLAGKDHTQLPNEDLVVDLRLYDSRAIDVAAFLESIIAAQWVLEEKFNKALREHLSNCGMVGRTEELKAALSISSNETFIVQNMREVSRMAAKIQASAELNALFDQPIETILNCLSRNPEVAQDIDDFLERFSWMKPLYYSGRPATRVDVIARLKQALQGDCIEKVAQAQRQQKATRESFSKAMGLIADNAALCTLANIVREFLHLRTYRLDVFFIAHNLLLGLFDEISGRIGLTYEDLIFLTVEEIVAATLGGNFSAKEIAARRKRGFAVSMEQGTVKWYSGSSLEEYLKSEWVGAAPTSELHGVVACRGRAHGIARIVLENADMDKVMRGDILVTTMTTPNFMEAIERAGAIVTSEGGMLCHAAIVSRELGLPCVIGTEIATEVISEGDELEIVAEGSEGIVRILS